MFLSYPTIQKARQKFTSWFIMIGLVLVGTFALQAQPLTLRLQEIGVEAGMPDNVVTGILQDRYGYMWFGTHNGLVKYDGYDMEVFHLPYRDSLGNISERAAVVESICESVHGDIWIGTAYGEIAQFDREKNQLQQLVIGEGKDYNAYKPQPMPKAHIDKDYKMQRELLKADSIFRNGRVKTVFADTQGRIWASLNNYAGIFILRPDSIEKPGQEAIHAEIEWLTYRYGLDRFLGNFHQVYEDEAGVMWIFAGRGLLEFHPATYKHHLHQQWESQWYNFNNNMETSMVDVERQIFWVGAASGGLQKFVKKNHSFSNFHYKPNHYPNGYKNSHMLAFFKGKEQGFIWCMRQHLLGEAAENWELVRFDPTKEQFHPVALEFEKPIFQKHHTGNANHKIGWNWINSIFQDREGNIWIGGTQGLFKHVAQNQYFTLVQHKSKALSSDHTSILLPDKQGKVWVSTDKGLDHWDLAKNEFEHFPFPTRKTYWFSEQNRKENWVYEMLFDADSNLWLGTESGLMHFNVQDKSFKNYEIAIDTTESGMMANGRKVSFFVRNDPEGKGIIQALSMDAAGDLWVGSFGRMVRVNVAKGTMDLVAYPGFSSYGFISNNVNRIFTDPKGHIWLGTENRVMYAFDPQQLPSKPIEATKDHFEAFRINGAQPRMVDSQGNLWASSPASGIVRVNLQSKAVKQWTTENGLAHNKTYGIVEDARGRIWIGTFKGLSCYLPETDQFRNFYQTDGLPTNTIDGAMPCKTSDGELLFATSTDGIIRFHPDDLESKTVTPEVAFTGFQLFEKEVPIGDASPLKKHISLTKDITLNHEQRDVTFAFAALHSVNVAKQHYQVMLENYDEAWKQIGLQRSAKYTNLLPGNYIFKVKAADSQGQWPSEFTSVRLHILPPWWQTLWAYFSYALLFAGLGYSFYRYQVNRKLQAADVQRLKELNKFKARFYTNITHEFRTPLTVIAGIAAKQVNDGSEKLKRQSHMIQRNARALLDLVNQLLDISKIENGSLTLQMKQADVVSFLNYAVKPFELLAQEKQLQFHWEAKPSVILMDFDAEKLQQVVTNLLSNAIKFTEQGSVEIALKQQIGKAGEQLNITVSDTGVGISKEQQAHVFELFYQGDNSSTRQHEGSGVGLAFSRELVQLMGGSIQIGANKGVGTSFQVELPITKNAPSVNLESSTQQVPFASANVPTTSSTQLQQAVSGQQKKAKHLVLIVEDNPDLQEYLRQCLDDDYRLQFASNGEQGLEKARKLIPDIMVCDVMMAKMDGFEMAKKLRNDERTGHIPLMFLTAKTAIADRLAGLKLGADAYLTKPFREEELLLEIARILGLREQLRKRYMGLGAYPPAEDLATQRTDQFLTKLHDYLERHLQDDVLTIPKVAEEMGMSRSQLHRKMVSITSKNTTAYINHFRLQKAKHLFEQNSEITVAEVAYHVGFADPNYFSRCFRKAFGISPSSIKSAKPS